MDDDTDLPDAQPMTADFEPWKPQKITDDDTLDPDIEAFNQVQQSNLQSALTVGTQYDPDTFAAGQQQAAETGFPAHLLPEPDEQLSQAGKIDQITQLAKQNPATLNFLTDPTNVALAHDDVPNLAATEQALSPQAQEMSGISRQLHAIGQSFDQGQAATEANDIGFQWLIGNGTDANEARLQQLQAPQVDYGQNGWLSGTLPAVVGSLPGLGSMLKGGAAEAIPILANARGPLLPFASILARPAFESGMVLNSIQQSAGDAANTFRTMKTDDGQPLDPDVVKGAAIATGILNGSLQMLPFHKYLDNVPGAGKILAAFSKDGVAQLLDNPTYASAFTNILKKTAQSGGIMAGIGGMTELIKTGGAELASMQADGSMNTLNPQEVLGRVLTAMGQGAQAGVGLGAVTSAPDFGIDIVRAQTASDNQLKINALNDVAAASKLRKRDPQAYFNFVDSVQQKNGGDVQNLYIPAQKMAEMFQAAKLDPQAVADTIPSIKDQFAEALATGGDIEIPVSDYATYLAGTDFHAALSKDIRYGSPDAMTANEADAFAKSAGSDFDQQIDDQAANMEQARDSSGSSDLVFKDIEQKLVNAGNDPDNAAQMASIIKAFHNSLGEKLDIDPYSLLQANSIDIQGPETAQVKPTTDQLDTAIGNYLDPGKEPKLSSTPVADTLKAAGGIDPKSPLVKELKAEGIDTKSLTKKGGMQDVDNLVAAEHPIFGETDAPVDANGYVDRQHVIDSLKAEQDGVALRTPEQQATLDRYHAPREAMEAEFERLGIDPKGMNREQIKAAMVKGGVELNQSNFTGPRGSIRFNTDERGAAQRNFTISLFRNQNLSTFLHEAGHYFLEVFGDAAEREGAPQSIKDDWQKTLDYLGAKDRASITTDNHETFARSFEEYLREGKAPSAELRPVFTRFMSWLKGIYQDGALRVQLSPEIRGVFDRLFATDDQIAYSEANQHVLPLFSSAEEAGMDDKQFAAYKAATEFAHQQSTDRLYRAVLREKKKLVSKGVEKATKAAREKVTADLQKEQVRNVHSYLTKNELADGSKVVGLPEGKLSKQALIEEYGGKDIIKDLPRGITTDKGGVHPDVIASHFGYGSGDAMIQDLRNMTPFKHEVDQRVAAIIKDKYGDFETDGRLQDQAVRAVYSEQRARAMSIESDALAKKLGKTATPNAILKAQAERLIDAKTVDKATNDKTYHTYSYRAGREAINALQKGDLQTAFEAKQKQLLAHHMAIEAAKAAQEVTSFKNRIKRLGSKAARKSVAIDYREQIQGLLQDYNFSNNTTIKGEARKIAFAQFVKEKTAAGEPLIDIPDYLLNPDTRTPYQNMSMSQLRGLRDTVANLEHLGRLKNKLLINGELRKKAEVRKTIVGSIIDNFKGKISNEIETRAYVPADIKHEIGALIAPNIKAASFIREMDGFKDAGPLWDITTRAANEAADAKSKMIEHAVTEMKSIYSAYSLKERASWGLKKEFRFDPAEQSLTREGMLSMALNWGNDGNKRNLLEGYGWHEDDVKDFLDKNMEKRDWDFVQNVWNHLNSYWPELNELERRSRGVSPVKVKATSFETPHGQYEGGYYPLKYDDRLSKRSEDAEEAFFRGGGAGASQTAQGHTQERKVGVDQKVRLDLSVASEHLTQIIHDITHREVVTNIHKVLNDRGIADTMLKTYGPNITKQLELWNRTLALGSQADNDGMARAMSWLRSGAMYSSMGFHLANVAMVPASFTHNFVRLGPKYAFKGIKEFFGEPSKINEKLQWAEANSRLLAERGSHAGRYINEIENSLGPLSIKNDIDKWGYFAMTKAYQLVDAATWYGGYHQAMDTHGDEALAFRQADQVVIDTQSSNRINDQASIQRGNAWQKLFTAFYSYANTKLQLSREVAKTTDFKSPKSIGLMVANMFMLYSVDGVLSSLALNNAPAAGAKASDWFKMLGEETANSFFGQTILTREAYSAVAGASGYQGPQGTRFFNEIGKAAADLKKTGAIDKDRLLKDLNDSAGVLLHYPAKELDNIVQAFSRASNGKMKNWYDLVVPSQGGKK